jgi:hypothetical protein
MLKLQGSGTTFVIRSSMFDIRYSFRKRGKPVFLELPTSEELAKHLRKPSFRVVQRGGVKGKADSRPLRAITV